MSKQLTKALPKDVAQVYRVIGLKEHAGVEQHFGPKYGKVNFSELTLPQAEKLFKMKFPYLAQIKRRGNAASSSNPIVE